MSTEANLARAEGWREGHTEGYKKGRDDGILIGYADAKTRAWNAIEGALGNMPCYTATQKEAVRRAMSISLGSS